MLSFGIDPVVYGSVYLISIVELIIAPLISLISQRSDIKTNAVYRSRSAISRSLRWRWRCVVGITARSGLVSAVTQDRTDCAGYSAHRARYQVVPCI